MRYFANGIDDGVSMLDGFIASEPHDAISLRLKPLGPSIVMPPLVFVPMLMTVDFDDQACAGAEAADWLLATEFETCEPPVAQSRPEPSFGVAHRLA